MKPETLARSPNLARRPFVNRRPVVRVSTLLWVVAGGLLLLNAVLWGTSVSDTSASREEAARLEAELDERAESLRQLDRELRGFALDQQNQQVRFLNHKIDQRTFPWSRLFDQLTEAMPAKVRLLRLSPVIEDDEGPGSDDEWSGWVELQISGAAAEGEALLEFVDALFAHPAFSSPTLASERRERGGELHFGLTVFYLPRRDQPEIQETAGPPGVDQSAPGETAEVVETASTGGGP